MNEAATASSWITIIGTLITTAGTVLVALITSKTRRDQKNIQREAEDNAEDNKKEILGAIDELQAGLVRPARRRNENLGKVIKAKEEEWQEPTPQLNPPQKPRRAP